MNFDNFTIKAQEVVQKATEIAQANQNQAVETSHLLKGMLMVDENVMPYLLKKLNVNTDLFSRALDKILESNPKVTSGQQFLSNEANQALQKAQSFAQEFKDDFVSVEMILLGILLTNNTCSSLLNASGINEKDLKAA